MRTVATGLVVLALAAGCGGDDTIAIDLTLVPDPNVNRPEDVAHLVDSLVLVLDAPGGLYHPGDDVPVDGAVQIENADGDPTDLELVATVPVGDDMPWIQIERGGLPRDVSLEILLLGRSSEGGATVARGGAQGVSFDAGRVDVPFNLVPSLLPPRIAEVVPDDGDVALDCFVGRVVLVFSKPIEPASFLQPGAVVFDPGGAPTELRVDASGRFGEVVPPPLQGDETVRYHLTVTTDVREDVPGDGGGQRLDQIPAEEGAQPFERDFVLPCEVGPQIPDPNCGDPEPAPRHWCGLGGRFECVEEMCVPTSCDGAGCEPPTVCDPATATCEVDCRSYGPAGACDGDRPRCDPDTGVCVAAAE